MSYTVGIIAQTLYSSKVRSPQKPSHELTFSSSESSPTPVGPPSSFRSAARALARVPPRAPPARAPPPLSRPGGAPSPLTTHSCRSASVPSIRWYIAELDNSALCRGHSCFFRIDRLPLHCLPLLRLAFRKLKHPSRCQPLYLPLLLCPHRVRLLPLSIYGPPPPPVSIYGPPPPPVSIRTLVPDKLRRLML